MRRSRRSGHKYDYAHTTRSRADCCARTGNGYYNTSHNNNNSNNIAGSERDEIGDCTDCNDGNASDTLSISSLAKTVSIDDMGLELDPGYTAEYPIVSDEYIAEYPILIACDCSMSEGGSRPLSHANTAHGELMSLQRRGVGVSTEAGAGTIIAQRVDTRMKGVAGVSKEEGARGRAVRLHESQVQRGTMMESARKRREEKEEGKRRE